MFFSSKVVPFVLIKFQIVETPDNAWNWYTVSTLALPEDTVAAKIVVFTGGYDAKSSLCEVVVTFCCYDQSRFTFVKFCRKL